MKKRKIKNKSNIKQIKWWWSMTYFDFERLLDFDLDWWLDFDRPPRDFDRLLGLRDRDDERRRRERLRVRDRLDRLDERDRRPRPPRRSSIKRIRRPFNSVSSNFSIAVFMSDNEANSTTLQTNNKKFKFIRIFVYNWLIYSNNTYPSFRRCLCASAYVTSPAWRM